MKKLSCGVIVTNGKVILGIVPWGKKNNLDLPKGGIDEGETPRQCAARELFEETGVRVREDLLADLGHFAYTSSKDLHLFIYIVDELPPLNQMKCTSYFDNPYGKSVPEAVGFEYVSISDQKFYKNLQPVLRKVAEKTGMIGDLT